MALIALLALPMAGVFNRVRAQRRALAAIRRVGGSVFYDYQRTLTGQWDPALKNPAPGWLQQIVPEECLRDISLVNIRGPRTTDDDLKALSGLSHIVYLDLEGSQVSDEGVAWLRTQKSLEFLYLQKTQVTDAGLAHLARLPALRDLFVDGSPVSDAGIAQLRTLPKLQDLGVVGTRVSAEAVAQLQRSRANLRVYHH